MPADAWTWLQKAAKTYPVNTATSGANTIFTPRAGQRFCVHVLYLQAEAGVDVTVKSGSTALSGDIAFAANAERTWDNSGAAVFAGRVAGEAFVLTLSGNIQVNGFAVLSEVSP